MNYKTTLHILVLCALIPILGFAQTSTGKRIYVSKSATTGPEADGQSWSTAFIDLQQALNRAQQNDTIWITAGTYYPTSTSDRSISFSIPNGVKVFGGFKGTETNLRERDWKANPSILSGDIGNNSDGNGNSYHVVLLANTDSTTLLNGFWIERGNSTRLATGQNLNGAGMLIASSDSRYSNNPRLENCIFQNNISTLGGAVAVIPHLRMGRLQMRNCIFQNNGALYGGAIYWLSADTGSMIYLDSCVFQSNSSIEGGSTLHSFFNGDLSIKNSIFRNNESVKGGGGMVIAGNVLIENCLFANSRSVSAAVVNIYSPLEKPPSRTTVSISKTSFIANGAGFDGGAISLTVDENDIVDMNVEDCQFKENRNSIGAQAINILNGRGNSRVSFHLDRCTFEKNRIYDLWRSPTNGMINLLNYSSDTCGMEGKITNCTFYKNDRPINVEQDTNGRTKLLILNSTFVENNLGTIVNRPKFPKSRLDITLQNSIFYEKPGPLSAILQNTNASDLKGFTFNYCLFSAPACKTTADTLGCGLGNIFGQYPRFVDSSTVEGLKLAPGSVAINAGRWHSGLSALDLLGQPRVQDCKVDLGAYESPSVLNPADTLITKAQIRSTPVNMALGEIGIQQISGGFPPYQLRWENGDSTCVRSALPAGQYQLTITDQQGCFKIYRYTVPFTTATRDVPNAQGQLSLVPNPLTAGQQLSLLYRDFLPGKWHLQVLDLTGKVVLQRSLVLQTNGEIPLPATEFPAGMYLLTLQRNEAFLSTKMMVIDRQ